MSKFITDLPNPFTLDFKLACKPQERLFVNPLTNAKERLAYSSFDFAVYIN